jgi:PAS domain S-box-containing protein
MNQEEKTRAELARELDQLELKISELERSENVRRQAEEALKKEQEKFRIVAEKSPLGMCIVGKDGRYLYLNPKFTEVFGYTLEDIPRGEVWFKKAFPDPEYRSRVINAWFQDLKEVRPGDVRTQTFTVACKDGSEKVICFRPVTMETGEQFVIYEDITVQKQAEEALRKSETNFRTLVGHIPQRIFLKDRNSVFITCNENFSRDLGIEINDIDGKTDFDFFTPELAEKYRADDQRILKSGDIEVFEEKYILKGQERWVRTTKAPYRYENDRIVGVLGVFEDITERKRAELALEGQLHFLRQLLDTIPIPIFYKDVQGVFRGCNGAFEKFVGLTREQVVGKTVFEAYPQDLAEIYHQKDLELFHHPGVQVYETSFPHADGTRHDIIFNKATYLDANGRVAGLTGAILDIAEQKRAKEILRESEERFRRVFEEGPIGMCMAGPDYRFTKANKAFCRMIGYTEQELAAMTFKDITHPEHIDRDAESVKKLKAGEIPVYRTEKRYLRKNGETVWADATITVMRDPAGGVLHFLSFIEDITERKRVEEAFRESEDRYRDLVESSRDLICTHDLKGNVLSVNAEPLRILGYKRDVVSKMNLRDILIPERRNEFDDYLRTIKETGKADGLMVTLTARGEKRIWEYHNTLRTEGVPEPIVRGMAHDVTERLRAEKEKTRLESQILQSQKMEAIGTLAGGIAHDFNNLLTSIIGYGNLLQMDMDDDDPRKLHLNQILTASEKAANLTQSLLAFSRKQVMELKPWELNGILKGIEKLLKRLLTEDIEFRVIPADRDIMAMVDVIQIDQVLMNLATNARDAMPKGGKLLIKADEVQLGSDFIHAHGYGRPGHYALISVADTGIGMDEKTSKKIFDPFFTTKEVGKGTGLGLSIVYGIVKQHNGYITVESIPNRGTVVNIFLPAVKAREEEIEPAEKVPEGGTETILVTEDNREVRKLVREVLTRKGYTVIEAEDGEEAVRKFLDHQQVIDLLLLDVVMPKKNGKEVYEEISRIKPQVKVLFTSGYTGDVIFNKGIHDDSVDFISKPLSPKELLLKIREVLNK